MAVYGHTDLKKDTLIELDGTPYRVTDYSHHAMGRGGAVVQVKLKNLLSGGVIERSFRSSDKISSADIERTKVQFLYRDYDFVFMNEATYDQLTASLATLGEPALYMAEGSSVQLMIYNNAVIGLEMPNAVYLKVTETEPGAKGDTATTALKPATVETGEQVMVPLFIDEGDEIKVDTRSGAYLERRK